MRPRFIWINFCKNNGAIREYRSDNKLAAILHPAFFQSSKKIYNCLLHQNNDKFETFQKVKIVPRGFSVSSKFFVQFFYRVIYDF